MIVKYVNSAGREVNLNKEPFKMLVSDLIDYEWEALENAGKIIGFGKKISSKEINIDIIGKGSRKSLNELTELFEYDVLTASPGKLYVDDYYLNCFIVKSKKSRWAADVILSCNFGLITDNPMWVKETHYSFGTQKPIATPQKEHKPVVKGQTYERAALRKGIIQKDFPHDYSHISDVKVEYPEQDFPFDYVPVTQGRRVIQNDSFMPCNFVMTIYGFAETPTIVINEHPYTIYTTVYEGERLVLNSASKTIEIVGRLGEVRNVYNSRNKAHSVFEKIGPNANVMTWAGTYGVDLTLLDERSEPKWNS